MPQNIPLLSRLFVVKIVQMTIKFDEDAQKRKLRELHRSEEEELVSLLAAKNGLEYINLVGAPINADALRLIPEMEAKESQAAAFASIGKKIKIAVRNPQNKKLLEILAELNKKGLETELFMTSTDSLEKAWNIYKDLSYAYESKSGSLEISNEEIVATIKQAKTLPQITAALRELISTKKTYRVSKVLETILAGAINTEASDVHFEPEASKVRLRYRLDGVLQDILDMDNETYALILSRIKLISGMKLNVKKDSQDGRFSIILPQGEIEVRVSDIPDAYNEAIVMRVLNPKSISIPLEEMGMHPKLLAIIEKEINRPDGMILTTGPTGSGKTTTLYAFIKKVRAPGIKIITIEDPIEYHLDGIVQTQVNDKGYNFLEGLRAAVRQDPDILMVGEIRDNETASIAINSALTGHLVFSTLHTNDAGGAFPRLSDLGISSSIMPSAIRVSMAQRLVRKLCDYCKKEISPTQEIDQKIQSVLNGITDKSLVPEEHSKIYQAVGCDKCNHTGYKGRVGIFEAIFMNEAIEKAVQTGSSDREIWLAAKDQGLPTMKEDGILKVIAGITSLEELERVVNLN